MIRYTNEAYQAFCQRSSMYTQLPWKTRVYTWEVLHDLAQAHGDKFIHYLQEFSQSAGRTLPWTSGISM